MKVRVRMDQHRLLWVRKAMDGHDISEQVAEALARWFEREGW